MFETKREKFIPLNRLDCFLQFSETLRELVSQYRPVHLLMTVLQSESDVDHIGDVDTCFLQLVLRTMCVI